MKPLLGLLLLLSVSSSILAQVSVKQDPLLGHYILANSAELVCIRDVRGTSPQLTLSQRLFDFLPNGQIASQGSDSTFTNGRPLNTARWMDAVACDVNGDGKDELVNAWSGLSGLFNISVSAAAQPTPPGWEWTSTHVIEEPGDVVTGPIRLVAANLDTTPQQEVIACYRVSGGLTISLYDSIDQATGALVKFGSELWADPAIREFDLAAGDFDCDGLDEIIFVFHYVQEPNHMFLLTVADFPEQRQPSYWPGQPFPTADTLWGNWKRMKITAGDFYNRGFDEAIVSVTLCKGDSGRQVFSYVSIDPQLRTYSMDLNYDSGITGEPPGWSWGYGWESDAVAADLNPLKKDGDELVAAGPGEASILKFSVGSANPSCLGKLPFLSQGLIEPYARRRFLAVADINADSSSESWIPEIVLAEHQQDSTTVLQVLMADVDYYNDITGLTRVAGSERRLGESTRMSEIVMGDFNGDGICLHAPKFVMQKSFYQPIVRLNVPPTHFDSINGVVYDICKIRQETPSDPRFKVTYTETQQQTSHFSSELTTSLGLSSGWGAGVSLFGMKMKATMSSSFAKGYYGFHSTDTTISTSQTMNSWGNDWILATISDYDLWEYPLFVGAVFKCGVLVQIPHYTSTEWFHNKDTRALNWTADHEVGNILSYPPKDSILARTGGNLLTSFVGKLASVASSATWELDLSQQAIDENRLTHEIGTDVGASISGWGMEASVSLDYSREDITTHTSSATKNATISVDVSDLDQTIADADYLITPYIYWGADGALVIDYAIDPSVRGGDPELWTFWENRYKSQADPAFVLPWRLDVEKGLGLNPNMKLYCKSIAISPATPSAGEVVCLSGTVRNFSLKDTDGPVTVRFYLGNPASGGTPIVGMDGQIDRSTIVPIRARGGEVVRMNWIVPTGLDNTARIYAVIDPDNLLSELHEDNNIGFVTLKVVETTGVEDEPVRVLPEGYVLEQNYPNPFNSHTAINYGMLTSGYVGLRVYDVLGREVAVLLEGEQMSGRHWVTWNADNMSSGVYFYRLTAGTFTETRRMVLLR